jgi:ATP-dependent DNA helicase RecG
VRDDGAPSRARIDDDLLLRLGELRASGNILPLPVISVERRDLEGHSIAVVAVEPSHVPPVRYKSVVWIRVGPRRARATAEEEARLAERRRARDLPFDARPMPSASLDALDLDLFSRTYVRSAVDAVVLAENERTIEQQLSALRLAAATGEPTAAGLVVLGLEPTDYIPGAYVQFQRHEGTDLASPVVHAAAITGPLSEVLRQLEDLLQAQVLQAVDITSGPLERRRANVPIVAVQQVVRNALMHRTYESSFAPLRIMWLKDRIEVLSPGGPFGFVTVENFGQPGLTDYRNPTIAEAMRSLGYVQRFGVGIAIAIKAMRDNGNPEPIFDANDTFVSVTLPLLP